MTHSSSKSSLAVWRWPVALALAGTIPAFYVELLQEQPPRAAALAYLLAALMLLLPMLRASRGLGLVGFVAQPLDLLLMVGLGLAAVLPPSSGSNLALGIRLAVALLSLLRLVLAMQHLVTRGGLLYLLLAAGFVLGLCGIGFWWLEPRAKTLSDGLWLAFTTAATVGYGDIVPSTPASKIFSVFVVMLGFGVLSLVTAAIATRWIETEERIIEREILRDVHRQMDALRGELAAFRRVMQQGAVPETTASKLVQGVEPAQSVAPIQDAQR